MREELRQATALLAAVMLGGRGFGTVVDPTGRRPIHLDVSEAEELVAGRRASAVVVDQVRDERFLVEGRRPSFRIFDATDGAIVALEVGAGDFRGHDSAGGSFFEGRQVEDVVEILDHEDGRVHAYRLLPGMTERRGG